MTQSLRERCERIVRYSRSSLPWAEHLSLLHLSTLPIVAASVLLFSVVGCRSSPKSSNQPALRALPNKSLAVAEVATAEVLSDSGAQQVLGRASSILKQNSCGLELSLSGNVLPLNVRHSTILSSDDYDEVCAQPGYIHIVDSISWCDGATIPDVLGCSSQPGNCMVVVRYNPPVSEDPQQLEETILWLHEYGHTKNLRHRSDSDAVMNPVIAPSHLRINSSECSAYLGLANAASSRNAQTSPATVRDFVSRVYIHGVPFEQAKQYRTVEDVKKLAAILGDHSQERYWPNVVTTLGMIGTREASQQLVAFLGHGEGKLSPDAFRAKTTALIAMGYVLGQSGRQSTLDYLAERADPESWSNAMWSAPSTSDTKERDLILARSAVAALGLSGDPKAEPVLRDLEHGKTIHTPFNSQIPRSAAYALDENKVVRETGFDTYVMDKERLRSDPSIPKEIPKQTPQ